MILTGENWFFHQSSLAILSAEYSISLVFNITFSAALVIPCQTESAALVALCQTVSAALVILCQTLISCIGYIVPNCKVTVNDKLQKCRTKWLWYYLSICPQQMTKTMKNFCQDTIKCESVYTTLQHYIYYICIYLYLYYLSYTLNYCIQTTLKDP
jgi:hypothetical protein